MVKTKRSKLNLAATMPKDKLENLLKSKLEEGYTPTEIAYILGCTPPEIYHVLKKIQESPTKIKKIQEKKNSARG